MKSILALVAAALSLQAHALPASSSLEARAAQACGFPTVPLIQAVSDTLSDRFYSTNTAEIERTLANKAYVRSAVVGYVFSNDTGPHVPNAVPFFRLHSAAKTDHYLTTSWDEVETAVGTGGYAYEGIVGYVFASTSAESGCPGTVPFNRAYNPANPDHFFSTNSVAQIVKNQGYIDEGIAAYLFPPQ